MPRGRPRKPKLSEPLTEEKISEMLKSEKPIVRKLIKPIHMKNDNETIIAEKKKRGRKSKIKVDDQSVVDAVKELEKSATFNYDRFGLIAEAKSKKKYFHKITPREDKLIDLINTIIDVAVNQHRHETHATDFKNYLFMAINNGLKALSWNFDVGVEIDETKSDLTKKIYVVNYAFRVTEGNDPVLFTKKIKALKKFD